MSEFSLPPEPDRIEVTVWVKGRRCRWTLVRDEGPYGLRPKIPLRALIRAQRDSRPDSLLPEEPAPEVLYGPLEATIEVSGRVEEYAQEDS